MIPIIRTNCVKKRVVEVMHIFDKFYFVRLLFFGVCHHDHVQCNTKMSLNYSFKQRLKERAKSKKNGANILYFFFALPVKFILILL